MITFSFCAGLVHAMAPDHWIPASILVWQKGWSTKRSFLFVAALLIFHILLGVGVFFLFDPLLKQIAPSQLVLATMVLVFSVLLLRLFRFARIRGAISSGNPNLWGVFAVVSLLGPCETIIPLLLRSQQLGIGYLSAPLAFAAGTLMTGVSSILLGRMIWNRPMWFPKGIQIAVRSSEVLPVLALVVMGGRALFLRFGAAF